MIQNIETYKDLIKKFEYDFDRFIKSSHAFDLMDCIHSLNALPEWIKNDSKADSQLIADAEAIEEIMKGNGFVFDPTQLDKDINQRLRLIRMICNHVKHKNKGANIPVIKSKEGNTFPMTLPAKFGSFIAIGDTELDAEAILQSVYDFWVNLLKKYV